LSLDLGIESPLRLNKFGDAVMLLPCIGWVQSSIAMLLMFRLRGTPY